ncbi:hypothetical protein M0802_014591 [Mischocyttarus mexicanus]|nr:hypothetical protein M0802_014591 [Mischocyttarus mexicanus]
MRGGAPPFPHAVAVLPPLPANHNQNHNHNHHHHQHYHDHHHHEPQPPQGSGLTGVQGPPSAGTTTIMTNLTSAMTGMTSNVASMRAAAGLAGMGGGNQCRQPPAYKVAAQMARLHRLGRAHSHEGVTYRTDHEDGTTNTHNRILSSQHPLLSRSSLIYILLHIYIYIHIHICNNN